MHPAGYRVRRLGPGDLALLDGLFDMFGAAFDEPDTYGAARPGPAYHERLLGDEVILALAAVAGDGDGNGGAVIGGLVAYELRKLERAVSEIYVYDLAVAAAHRRRGVATALLRHLQGIAAERGAQVIVIQADRGDAPAIALYRKLGAEEEVLHFDIPVG